MASMRHRFLGPAWAVLAVLAYGALFSQARDPRDTELYREMKIQDPSTLFIPPLILKHVVQLPSEWQDPLGPEQRLDPCRVLRVSRQNTAVVVESEHFTTAISLEGDAVHLVWRRNDPAAVAVPSLTLKEHLPPHELAVEESAEAVILSHPALKRPVARVQKSDSAIDLYWGDGPELRADHFQAAYSRLDKRVYVLSTLRPDDHIYGLGMKTGAFDKRDQSFIMWNYDQYGYYESKDPVYASVPFYLQTGEDGQSGRGLFVDDSSDVMLDFGYTRPGWNSFSTTNGQAECYYFGDGRLARVLAAYQDLTGVFQLPPLWALGYHQSAHTYFPEARLLELAQKFRDKNLPCDALYLDIIHQDGYRPFTWNAEHFPQPGAMIAKLHELGFKVLTIIDPGIKVDEDYSVFQEGRREGFFLRTDDGRLYANNIWPGYSVFPDFLQPGCRDWWAKWHEVYLRQGVDAFKNDMSEPATFNKTWSTLQWDETTDRPSFLEEGTLDDFVISRGGPAGDVPHRFFHNVYGLYESVATWEAQERFDNRRPFVLMRNTFASGQKTTYIWTGDTNSDWSSLRLNIQILLNLNLSGFPISGADNGGFGGRTTPELFTRWTQFSAFSAFFRTHYFYVEQCLDKEPWSFGPQVEAVIARYIRLRYQLLPYLYTSVWQARQQKRPLLQPLFLRWEDDPKAYAAQYQYLWGEDFLVAPVVEPGATGRFAYLPAGEWYDFWTESRLVSAGESRYVHAPLDTIPVWVRAGRIIPEMAPGRNTAAFPPETVTLKAYLHDGQAEGLLYLDDGATRDYRQGEWAVCRFQLRTDGEALELRTDFQGRRRFAPRELQIRMLGLADGCTRLRYRGQDYPLAEAGPARLAKIRLEP